MKPLGSVETQASITTISTRAPLPWELLHSNALSGSSCISDTQRDFCHSTPSTVKLQSHTLTLWPGCEPCSPVICPKKGFYFSSGERSPLKKVQSMLEEKQLSTGIHLIHFTSCTLPNPEPEVCMYVSYGVADRKCVPRETAMEKKLHKD